MSQEQIGLAVKKVELKCNKITSQLLQPFGLTSTQFRVLRWLFKQENTQPRQHDIELALTMSNPTVTGILTNLEKNKWITRKPHPNDKRSNHIVLTDKAYQHQKELYQISGQIDDELTKNLTPTDRQSFRALLQLILAED